MNNLPSIIAVTAPCRYSGKGTVADVLASRFGYLQFNYALPIKTMFVTLLMYAGVDQDLYPRILDGDMKEMLIPGVGLSLRQFAEGVGTTWGRNMVHPNLWIDLARPKIQKLLDRGVRLVIQDARFPNECDLVKCLGGKIVRVVRPVYNGGLRPSLASEGHLENYQVDFIFANEGSIESLQEKVTDWMLSYDQPRGIFERVK